MTAAAAARPQLRPGILDIAPYVGGQSKIAGVERVIRLASNEGAFGPNPRAIEAYLAVAKEIHRYPDGHAVTLREAIAARYGLEVDRIVCGNGSDELLTLCARAFAGAGDELLYNHHGFLHYPIAARSVGAVPVTAPEKDLTANVDALLAKVTSCTKIVMLANPNNPTGTYIPSAEIQRLRRELPGHILLVIDAAYSEFVTEPDYECGLELVRDCDNTVMTRTFSKIHALGGMRIGWAYCPAFVVDAFNRARDPFNLSIAAQAAAAAAIQDEAFEAHARDHNARWRDWTSAKLRDLDLDVTPSAANFILVRFPSGPQKNAGQAFEHLKSRAILTRRVSAYDLHDHVRITIGTESDMQAVVAALSEFMQP